MSNAWLQNQKNHETSHFTAIPPVLPGRLTAKQAALVLGFSEHDIPILIAGRLLVPLGKPAPNGTKYFATVEIQRLHVDQTWMHKATHYVNEYWKGKNAQKAALKKMPLASSCR